ncbi:radical SAM protein [Paraclostridium sp. AKS46]|nr:radical SAM protein [Paraclostridium sp. AKS46]
MKNLTINISGKCNAECKHCCFSCSPYKEQLLTETEIWESVNYGILNNEINEIAITGGEPFLYEDLVCSIIEKVSDSGKIVTCITNGFWGVSKKVAREKLEKLSKLGLKVLTISCDDFHNEYIPIDYINNILSESFDLPIRISMNMTVTKDKDGNDLLYRLKDNLLGVSITRFSAGPVGNAKNLDRDKLYYKIDTSNYIKCSEPSSGLVIHHDGDVYPCCSPMVFETILKIGSIRDYKLSKLESKFKSNILIYIIKKKD